MSEKFTRIGDDFANDRVVTGLRGFGPLGILAILVILVGFAASTPLSAILVLVWTRLSHTPWREIGYVRPPSWIGSVMVGLVFGVAFKFAMKAILMPLLGVVTSSLPLYYSFGPDLWNVGWKSGQSIILFFALVIFLSALYTVGLSISKPEVLRRPSAKTESRESK